MTAPDSDILTSGWQVARGRALRDSTDEEIGRAVQLVLGIALGVGGNAAVATPTQRLQVTTLGALRQLGALGPGLLFCDLPDFTLQPDDGAALTTGIYQLYAQQLTGPDGQDAIAPDGTHLVAWAHSQPPVCAPDAPVPVCRGDISRETATRKSACTLRHFELAHADPAALGASVRLLLARLSPQLGRAITLLLLGYLTAAVAEVKRHTRTASAQATHHGITRPGLALGSWRLTIAELASGPDDRLTVALGVPGLPGIPQPVPQARRQARPTATQEAS